jgi:hypothetical protein
MLSAVYYPHTAVRDEEFLKHALLYWDEIEYISPWEDFDALPRYSTRTMRTLSKFLKPRVPSISEKERAHAEIMKLVDGDLPGWLRVDRVSTLDERKLYSIFANKLLPETWHELNDRKIVFRKHGDVNDYVSHTYLGLTLMAVLARCCAGTVKHTITDQLDAYGTVLKHIEFLSGTDNASDGPLDPESRLTFERWGRVLGVQRPRAEDTERKRLISITLDVIDSSSLSVDALVRLRTDKQALGVTLRQHYADAIEEYVDKLSEPGLSDTDVYALREDFRQKMTLDMKLLYEELAPVAQRTILSKEVAVAVAAPVAGAALLTSSGVGLPLGGAFAIGALGKLRTEYRSARDAVFSKHPMAFLYRARRYRVY